MQQIEHLPLQNDQNAQHISGILQHNNGKFEVYRSIQQQSSLERPAFISAELLCMPVLFKYKKQAYTFK